MRKRNQPPCAEWVDKLALRQNELEPEERAALQAHLATCDACATAYADYQGLIARIRALPQPAQSSLLVLPELFRESPERGNRMSNQNIAQKPEQEALTPIPPTAFLPRRSWKKRALGLVAVLFVTSLVVAFALITIRPWVGNVAGGTFRFVPGWTQFASFQGQGSQTIQTSAIRLPAYWGEALFCQGSGKLNLKMTGTGYNSEGGTDNCASSPAPVSAPAFLHLTLSREEIQTIQVTAPDSMTWHITLVKETPQPALKVSSAWVPSMGIGGRDNSGGNILPSANQPTSNRWALLMMCIEGGQVAVELTDRAESTPKIFFPACNGQPALHVIDYSSTNSPLYIQTTKISGNPLYIVELLDCGSSDKNACQ